MNKMFKKLMAVTATLAIAATMSVSAFAEGETEETTPATPSASHTAGSVEVKNYTKPDTAVDGTTQYTVMVFLNSEDGISADEIYYINQGSDPSTLLADMRVKATTAEDGTTSINLPDGDYTVRIGNSTGSVVNIDLKVEAAEEGVTLTLNYGDVNGDGSANSMDASLVLQKLVGTVASFTDQEGREIPEAVGDVNGDGSANSMDASLILQKLVGTVTEFTDQEGNVLTTYTYTYVAPTE